MAMTLERLRIRLAVWLLRGTGHTVTLHGRQSRTEPAHRLLQPGWAEIAPLPEAKSTKLDEAEAKQQAYAKSRAALRDSKIVKAASTAAPRYVLPESWEGARPMPEAEPVKPDTEEAEVLAVAKARAMLCACSIASPKTLDRCVAHPECLCRHEAVLWLEQHGVKNAPTRIGVV